MLFELIQRHVYIIKITCSLGFVFMYVLLGKNRRYHMNGCVRVYLLNEIHFFVRSHYKCLKEYDCSQYHHNFITISYLYVYFFMKYKKPNCLFTY